MSVEEKTNSIPKIRHDLQAQLLIIRGFSKEIEQAISDRLERPLLIKQGHHDTDLKELESVLDEDVRPCVEYIVSAQEKVQDLISSARAHSNGTGADA